MKNLTLRNIVKVCRGVYHGPEEALDFWRSRDDFELVLCTEDNRVIVTEGLEAGYRPAGEDRGYTYEIARR